MALLPSRRVAAIVFLLLCLSAYPDAQQTQLARPAEFRLDLTVDLSMDGKLYPVTGSNFYLMDSDPQELLKDAGVELATRLLSYGEDEGEALVEEFISSARRAPAGGSKDEREFYERAIKVLRPHIVAVAMTDENGNASMTVGKAGTYYIVGNARPPAYAVWDFPAKLDRGQVAVRLDRSNTMASLRKKDSQ